MENIDEDNAERETEKSEDEENERQAREGRGLLQIQGHKAAAIHL